MSPSWGYVSQRTVSNPQQNQHQLFLGSVCFQVVDRVLSSSSMWKVRHKVFTVCISGRFQGLNGDLFFSLHKLLSARDCRAREKLHSLFPCLFLLCVVIGERAQ